MPISDSPDRQKEKSLIKRRSPETTGKWWSDGQKVEAVKTFLMTGNLAMTSRILKIPENTIRVWRKQVWWADIEQDLRLQDELQLSVRLQKIVGKSFDIIEDRLDKGDFIYNQKTGKMIRKPVPMKDANKVASDAMLRHDLITRRNQTQASPEATADKLLALATKFTELAGLAKQKEQTIELRPEDVSQVGQDFDVPSGEVYTPVRDGDDSEILSDEEIDTSGPDGDFGSHSFVRE